MDGVSNSGRFFRLGSPIVISTSLIFFTRNILSYQFTAGGTVLLCGNVLVGSGNFTKCVRARLAKMGSFRWATVSAVNMAFSHL